MWSRFLSRLLLSIIKGYQTFISPVLPARCRYYPTCSEYGRAAGCRCHPLGGHGIDFVPLPLYKLTFIPLKDSFVSRETIIVERGVYKDKTSYAASLNSKLAPLS